MAITQTISTLSTAPTRADPTTFDARADTFLTELVSLPTELNTFGTEANALATSVNGDKTLAQTAATLAQAQVALANAAAVTAEGHANFKGDWVAGYNTTGYSLGFSVSYTDGFSYVSKVDANLVEPTTLTNTTEWDFVEAVLPSDLALKANADNPSFTGEITEQVYALAGTVIDPANGTVQTKTLATNTTFTESLTTGQSVTLVIAGGDTYTITWPTYKVLGTVVTPTAEDIYVLTKVGTTLYIAGGSAV